MKHVSTAPRRPCPTCRGSGHTDDLVAVSGKDGFGFRLARCPRCAGAGWLDGDDDTAAPAPWLPTEEPEG